MYVIIKYFYPKELRRAITKLKAEDNYRSAPTFFHELGYISGGGFILLVIYEITSWGYPMFGIISLVLFFFGSIKSIRNKCKYRTAYAIGELQAGTILDVKVNRFKPDTIITDIHILRKSDNKILIVPELTNVIDEKGEI